MGITAAIGGIADALGGAAVADVGVDAAVGGGLGSVIGGAAATDALAAGGLGSVIGGAAATDALAAGGADAALGGGLGSVIGGSLATDALAGGAGAASANAGLAGAVGATTGLAAAPGGAGAGTLGSLGGGAGVSAAGAAAPASIAPGAGDALTLFSSDAPAAAAGGYTPGVTATDAFAQGGGAVTSGPLGSVGDTAAFDAAGTPGSGLTSAAGAATNGLPVPPVPPAGGAGAGNVDGGLSFGNSTVNGGLAAGAGSPSSGVGSALGGVGHFLGNNANWLLPAALVGYQGLKSSEGLGNIPGYNQLNAQAGQLASQGSQLQSYLQTGTLPPGVQTSLQQAGSAATASIKSQYAARGDAGSTAEAQDIANVQNTLASQGAQIATQLLDTGISESNLSAQLYSQIMGANMQNDQQLGNALTTLAAGAARPTVTVNQASP